jgi:hypothetical protein
MVWEGMRIIETIDALKNILSDQFERPAPPSLSMSLTGT